MTEFVNWLTFFVTSSWIHTKNTITFEMFDCYLFFFFAHQHLYLHFISVFMVFSLTYKWNINQIYIHRNQLNAKWSKSAISNLNSNKWKSICFMNFRCHESFWMAIQKKNMVCTKRPNTFILSIKWIGKNKTHFSCAFPKKYQQKCEWKNLLHMNFFYLKIGIHFD